MPWKIYLLKIISIIELIIRIKRFSFPRGQGAGQKRIFAQKMKQETLDANGFGTGLHTWRWHRICIYAAESVPHVYNAELARIESDRTGENAW